MINSLLSILAPHHCYGCQKIGIVLCDNCKFDITSEPFSQCIVCRVPTLTGVCAKHRSLYEKAWCIGERHDVLEALIDGYKFANLKDGPGVFAAVLASILPEIPSDTRLVPIPTTRRHIRQRGYDHTLLMARQIKKQRGGELYPILRRQTNTIQRGANRKTRIAQSEKAFMLDPSLSIDPTKPHLIIDDVLTTGATIDAAAKLLRAAGAEMIWVAVATRQPLD